MQIADAVGVLETLAGRASGAVTRTEVRDASRTILDHLDAPRPRRDADDVKRELALAIFECIKPMNPHGPQSDLTIGDRYCAAEAQLAGELADIAFELFGQRPPR